MFTKLRWIASLAALAALSAAPGVATAAGSGTPVSVDASGTQTVVDEAAGTFAMQGSLAGTRQTTKFVPRYTSSSQFVATGKELFTGCLDANGNGSCDTAEPTGNLKFTFMYWASFDPAAGALLHGTPPCCGLGPGRAVPHRPGAVRARLRHRRRLRPCVHPLDAARRVRQRVRRDPCQ
jgi:hypothetical protein